MNANFLLAATSIIFLLPAQAQQSLDSTFRTTGTAVVAAFEPQRQVLQRSSAVILDGRKEICYGVVVSSEGHILTKASEILGTSNWGITVNETKYSDARLLTMDPIWDVALLKIEASGLQPVDYAPTSNVSPGTWVVANGATTRTSRRLLAGVVSAKIREILPAGGAALGVVLKANSKTLVIESLSETSGAKGAGLQKDDVILTIEGKKVKKVEEIAEILKDRKAGTTVKIKYRRGSKEATADVRLSSRTEMFSDQMNRNDAMSGEFSKHRSGYPRVMQHDILGAASVVGGPLLDLDGRCIGMNIARANRAESFAIPVEDLKALAERLIKEGAN